MTLVIMDFSYGKFPGSLLFWGGDFIVDGICDGSCLRFRVVEFRKLYG